MYVYVHHFRKEIKRFLLLVSGSSTGSLPREIGASGVRLAMMILSCIARRRHRKFYSGPAGLIYTSITRERDFYYGPPPAGISERKGRCWILTP
jgi:hypothetical protein